MGRRVGFRHNPAPAPRWVLEVIGANEQSIVQLHGERMLPHSPEMLGCGGFGCVLQTVDPRWTLKVSVDGSEAFFARAQAMLGIRPKGVCEYLEPLRVETPVGPMWIMWRQQVTFPNFDSWYYAHNKPPPALEAKLDDLEWSTHIEKMKAGFAMRRKWGQGIGIDAFEILRDLQQKGLGVAMRFAWFLSHVSPSTADFALALNTRSAEAIEIFDPRKNGIYWQYTSRVVSNDTLLETAIDLMAYRWHLEQIRDHKLMGPLANALGTYLDQGLLLADVQPDNIAKLGSTWTLFDAGFTIPLDPRWEEMWLDEGIREGLWFSNDRHNLMAQLQV